MSTLPRVAIVGRTNVGKSTLFNRLSEKVKSLTLDFHGVTRDFIKDTVTWQARSFELIDTGGITLRKSKDPLFEAVRAKALEIIHQSDLILFVVDGTDGLIAQDREIATFCHKLAKPVLLIINKSDSSRSEQYAYEWRQLGFGAEFPISATHGTGIGELLDGILQNLPQYAARVEVEDVSYKVVLLGKPNVGKSSLLNALLNQERAIVSDIPGTTREAISEPITFYQEDLLVTDTAGIRRKRSVNEPLETLMVKSSFRALEHAHIVMLLVDASQGVLSDQELKLAFYALEEFKALIILFNKQDLTTPGTQHELANSIDEYQHLLKKVETLSISCKTGKNIGKILPLIKTVWQRYNQLFSDDELTILFKDQLIKRPMFAQEQPLLVYQVKQVRHAPITLLLTVNNPVWFGQSQFSYFENIMRAHYELHGVPIKFALKKR